MSREQPKRVRIGLQDANGAITDDFLEVTATLSDSHEMETVITSNPTERGTVVNDHRYSKQIPLTIRGIFSDCYRGAGVNGNDVAAHPTVSGREAWETINRFRLSNSLCYVTTTLRGYSDMAIQKVNATRDWKTGNVLKFTMVLKQINLVSAEREETQIALRPKKKKVPKKETEEFKSCVARKRANRSAAFAGVEGLTGLFRSPEENAKIVAERERKIEEARAEAEFNCRVEEDKLAEKRFREEQAGK